MGGREDRVVRKVLLVFALLAVAISAATGPGAQAMFESAASTVKLTPDQPDDLAVAHDGDLYIADRGRNEILEWMPSGRFRVIAGTGAVGLTGDGGPADRAELNFPGGLVIASSGTIYFAQSGRYLGPISSSGGMLNTVIREITPAGTIRTIAGIHPSCARGAVRSIPAQSALFYGAQLSPAPGGGLAVDAGLCVNNIHDQEFGPNLLLTSGRFVKDVSNPVPAVASIDCGSGVPGPGFHLYACSSGGGGGSDGHGPELLVVRSDGSSVAYPDNDNQSGEVAVGDGEVVVTYDGNLVRVTSSRLVPLLTSHDLVSDLHLRIRAAISGIVGLSVSASGNLYFVASILYLNRTGCQSRILELTGRGALHQIWSSSTSKNIACF